MVYVLERGRTFWVLFHTIILESWSCISAIDLSRSFWHSLFYKSYTVSIKTACMKSIVRREGCKTIPASAPVLLVTSAIFESQFGIGGVVNGREKCLYEKAKGILTKMRRPKKERTKMQRDIVWQEWER